MFTLSAAFILALSTATAVNAVSTAELVAQLRTAPTAVDRINALNDSDVSNPLPDLRPGLTYKSPLTVYVRLP